MAAPRGMAKFSPELRNKIYHLVFADVTEIDEETTCACTLTARCPHGEAVYKPIHQLKQHLSVLQVCTLWRREASPMLYEYYVPQIGWFIRGRDEAPARLAGFLKSIPKNASKKLQVSLQAVGSDTDEAIIQRDNAFAANAFSSIRAIEGHHHSYGRDLRIKAFDDWLHLHRFRSLPIINMFEFEGEKFDFEFQTHHSGSYEHCLLITGPLRKLVKKWDVYYRFFEDDRQNHYKLSLLSSKQLHERYCLQTGAPQRQTVAARPPLGNVTLVNRLMHERFASQRAAPQNDNTRQQGANNGGRRGRGGRGGRRGGQRK